MPEANANATVESFEAALGSKLQLGWSMGHEKLEHFAFSADGRQILRAIAVDCDFLELHWGLHGDRDRRSVISSHDTHAWRHG
jgi:hypothetical protein